MTKLSSLLQRPVSTNILPRKQAESSRVAGTPLRASTALRSQFERSSFSAPEARARVALRGDTPQVQPLPGQVLRLAPGGGALATQRFAASYSGVPPYAQETRPGSVAHHSERALSPEERERALAVIFNAGTHESSAEFLREHTDAAARAEFIRLAIEEGRGAHVFSEFDNASTPERQQAVANALNAAYERGTLSLEDLRELLQEPGDNNRQNLGEVFRLTHNPELINAFVEAEFAALASADPTEQSTRAQAIAQALAGLPAEDFQAFLAEHSPGPNGQPWSNELAQVFSHLSDPNFSQTPVVAQLFEQAALVNPPTEQSLALFDTLVPHIGDSEEARTKAASFFLNHSEELLATTGTHGDGALPAQRQAVLADFFASTLFTEPPPSNREALQEHLAGVLGSLHSSLTAVPDGAVEDLLLEQGRLLGSLVGTLEVGLRVAAERVGAENAAAAGGVDLLATFAEALPSLPFPFADELQSAAIDGLRDWLVGRLENPAPEASDHVFHGSFGQGFDNPRIAGAYDETRGAAHDNANNPGSA